MRSWSARWSATCEVEVRKMRVALDAQLAVGTATGIGEYIDGLIGALGRDGFDVVALREPRLDPWRFDRRLLWDQVLLPRLAGTCGADLLHCTGGTVPWAVSLPFVVTVHDLAWLHVQSHAPAYARYYFGPFSLRCYRRAARIAVDSNFSRDALLRLLDGYDAERVWVVYPGVREDFCRVARSGGDGRTILAVGTVERRKNLAALIGVLPGLNGARLVAIGPPTAYAAECLALAERLGVADRVELNGYVARERLIDLYASCAAVAVPSRYEGFGYAAAQALCAGVPCVVSDQSSLPEIVGSNARVVPVDDAGAWTDALSRALRGDDDQRALGARADAAARYSWTASARRIEAMYAAALEAG
jgi:glycosyltransferase involved in cell wall biosynthesis